MDTPFELQLAGLENPHAIWVTLEHTVADVKERICYNSTNYILKPIYLEVNHQGRPLADSDPLNAVFGVSEPSAAMETLSLDVKINYALGESADLSETFDIHVQYNGGIVKCRGTLQSTVLSVKNQAATEFGVDIALTSLLSPSGQALQDSQTLQDVLQGVYSLTPPCFLLRKNDTLVVLAHSLCSGKIIKRRMETSVTVGEVKSWIASSSVHSVVELYHGAHHISAENPSELLLDVLCILNEDEIELLYSHETNTKINIDGEDWNPTGKSFIEVENGNRTKVIEQSTVSSETFRLDYNGSYVDLSTSECILNEGYILLSPVAYAKVGNQWGGQVHAARTAEELTTFFEEDDDWGESIVESEILQPRDAGSRESVIAAERMLASEPVLAPEPADPVHEFVGGVPEEVAPEAGQIPIINGRDSVFHRLFRAAEANIGGLRGWIFELGLYLFLVGLDGLKFLSQPRFLWIIMIGSWMYFFIVRGGDLANWIDGNLLNNAPQQLDFAIAREVALVCRVSHLFYELVFAYNSSIVTNMIIKLRRPRHAFMRAFSQRQDMTWYFTVGVIRELAALVIMFGATLMPGLHADISAKLLEQRNQEPEELREAMRAVTKDGSNTLIRAIEVQCGQSYDVVMDASGENADRLVFYYFAVMKAVACTEDELLRFLELVKEKQKEKASCMTAQTNSPDPGDADEANLSAAAENALTSGVQVHTESETESVASENIPEPLTPGPRDADGNPSEQQHSAN